MERCFRLTVACPDAVGIVAKIGDFIASHNGWIVEANHHSDQASGWFFMRHEIRASSMPFGVEEFGEKFAPIAAQFNMKWSVSDSGVAKKIILMASKESHCLADLLHRRHSKELDCEIVAVISNHADLRSMVEWHEIPYHHVAIDKMNKLQAFEEIESIIDSLGAELIVLARYMQILPPTFCEKYSSRVINIHHSFLPSFMGARPYHQAAERGVKLIGATCHYVTSDLDAGPIIDQDVIRVTHRDTASDMVRLGKDIEKIVLARGVRNHLEDRIVVYGNRTMIFN